MAILRITLPLVLFICFNSAFAQSPLKHANKNGKWTFTHFDSEILKVNYQPSGYKENEQVSNAVIAKPSSLDTKSKDPQIIFNKDESVQISANGTTIQLVDYFDSTAYRGFHFTLAPGEKIFGTGERSIPLNRRGYKLNLYNNPSYGYSLNAENLNYSVPFILSSNGYGIFFDNPSKGYLDIGKSHNNLLEYGASSGELSFYIIPGKSIDEIVHRYELLTGTQPLPPRWAFGNFMSRFGYRSDAQVRSTLDSMRLARIPVDAVIIDLFWFGDSVKGTLGNLDWTNKTKWPDPPKMVSDLKKQGIKTILITEPFILNTTPNYQSSLPFQAVDSTGKPFVLTQFYFGYGGIIDLFKKDAQNWFWSKYMKQIDIGIQGWWGDLGEPENHPAAVRHNLKDLGFNRLFKADDVHNIYGHYWDKMLYEKYAKEFPEQRLFNLNRSGYAGSQRYSIFPWSGDVSRSWEGLQAQLPLMIGMSMSGIPYIHADAGGYAGGSFNPELYVRWLQFAAFTPVFRPHGTALGDLDPGVKSIPSEAAFYPDPYQSIVRRYIKQRYAMMPYNYTLAYQQAKEGKLLVRPMFYDNSTDSNLYNADKQYMWGSDILVSPVLNAAVNTKQTYLPEGKWYNFLTGQLTQGKTWVTDVVTLSDIPLYVKAGAILPSIQDSLFMNSDNYSTAHLTLTYYPGEQKSSYTLYDDDGKLKSALASHRYELLTFMAVPKEDGLAFTVKSNGGNFSGKPLHRHFDLRIVWNNPSAPASITIGGKQLKKGIDYHLTPSVVSQPAFLHIDVLFSGKPVMVEIKK